MKPVELLHEISVTAIYLMGVSFILGSFFTLLLLVLLDWVREHSNRNNPN